MPSSRPPALSLIPAWLLVGTWLLIPTLRAQNRGVYPLGMSATSSGITPRPGFTYSNQLLIYSRDHSKDDDGATLPAAGTNDVVMDMNSIIWVSTRFFKGAHYSAAATLPFARNDLTSDLQGQISGGGGFADSYYMPFILGWNRERISVRAIYGFLAPTGRFVAGANNNVGSGYWTHALSTGQTVSFMNNKTLTLSVFQMYEFHTTQEGSGVHPGQTWNLDYSLLGSLPRLGRLRLQAGLAGYEQRQTTAKTSSQISAVDSSSRYAVNSLGIAINAAFVENASLGVKYFKEFRNRSTYQGYSLQILGVFSF